MTNTRSFTTAPHRRSGTPRAAVVRARRGAFTLLELLVVMAIMSVLAAMAVPRYGRAMARYRVEAAARRVQADLAYARQRARTLSQGVTVSFDAAAETYSIVGMPDPDRKKASYQVDVSQSPYLGSIDSVDFGGAATVTFSGFGIPDAGGDVKVGSGNYTKTVYVDGVTGEASIQ